MIHFLSIMLTLIEVVVCLLLIGLVLIQRSKGDGISSAIGGGMGESIFGANVGNVVTRTTVVLGIVFLLNTICLTVVLTRNRTQGTGSVMDDLVKQPTANRAAPAFPGPAPMPSAPVAPAAPAAPAAP